MIVQNLLEKMLNEMKIIWLNDWFHYKRHWSGNVIKDNSLEEVESPKKGINRVFK